MAALDERDPLGTTAWHIQAVHGYTPEAAAIAAGEAFRAAKRAQ